MKMQKQVYPAADHSLLILPEVLTTRLPSPYAVPCMPLKFVQDLRLLRNFSVAPEEKLMEDMKKYL